MTLKQTTDIHRGGYCLAIIELRAMLINVSKNRQFEDPECQSEIYEGLILGIKRAISQLEINKP